MKIEDGKVTEHENASSFAAPHVRNELKRLVKMDNPPVEKNSIMVLNTTSRKMAGGIFVPIFQKGDSYESTEKTNRSRYGTTVPV